MDVKIGSQQINEDALHGEIERLKLRSKVQESDFKELINLKDASENKLKVGKNKEEYLKNEIKKGLNIIKENKEEISKLTKIKTQFELIKKRLDH